MSATTVTIQLPGSISLTAPAEDVPWILSALKGGNPDRKKKEMTGAGAGRGANVVSGKKVAITDDEQEIATILHAFIVRMGKTLNAKDLAPFYKEIGNEDAKTTIKGNTGKRATSVFCDMFKKLFKIENGDHKTEKFITAI